MKILEVNNIDLAGRRFNGYDFLENIKNKDIDITQTVVIKQSQNDKVKELIKPKDIEFFYKLQNLEEEVLSIHSNISVTSPALFELKEYKDCDIIHFHMFHNSKLSLYSLLKISREKKVIISLHDPWFFTGHCVHFQECDKWKNGCKQCPDLKRLFPLKKDYSNILWNLKRKVFEKIDVDLIVSSKWMYDLAKNSPITKNQRIHLIPFGLDTNVFSNSIEQKKVRKKFNISNEDIVLFFRSQKDFKGTDYIKKALEEINIKQKISIITCSEKGNLKELEDKYNIVEMGNAKTNEIIEAFNACDIFLMPSIGESFGLMAIEAMSCEKPVIIFNNTALPSVTHAPNCGVLVKNKNYKDLKEKILMLINNPNERTKRGKLGRKIVLENYRIEEYYKQIEKLYFDVNKRTKKPRNLEKNSINKLELQKAKLELNVFTKILFKKNKHLIKDLKYDVKKIKYNEVDYSDFGVQELINDYNIKLFKIMNGEKQASHKSIKKSIKKHLKKDSFLYKILKKIYKILSRR